MATTDHSTGQGSNGAAAPAGMMPPQNIEAEQKASDNAAVLNKTVLTINHQAGDDGRLFGSVTTEDLSNAIREARGLRIDRRHIQLDDPIKSVGTHMVSVEVAPGVTATVKTIVVEQK